MLMDNFREWLSDNLRYILLGLAAALVVIIIVCVVKLAGGSKKKDSPASATQVTELTDDGKDEEVSGTGTQTTPAASSSLTKDEPSILELVQKYYTAVASKDTATLATIVDPWNSSIEASILANTLVERYDNISTYSKAGPSDGTYVVYAYYDGKIAGINTEAPSLALLYVVTNDSGALVVGDRDSSSEVSDFIREATAASDVQALKDDVNQKLYDAEESDPDLKALIENQTTGQQETEADGAVTENQTSGSSSGTATTTAGVNIRSEASADSSIVIVTYQGAEVNVIERGDEWTHVTFVYNGATYEGYISTQYLDFGDSTGADAADDASQDAAGADTTADAAAQGTDTSL